MFKSKVLVLLSFLSLVGVPALAAAPEPIPEASIKVPPMVKEQSVSTYVPSSAAPGQGLAVNIIYPKKPRYEKIGAPVVVVVPGGHGASGLDFSMHAAQQGFIEVRFAFPGGGKNGFVSTGIYDQRGPQSKLALKDVMRFAAGAISDREGKSINQLLPVPVYNKVIGAVGWSNGGNVLLSTLAKYAPELKSLGWLAFYESPLGQMFYLPTLGGAQDMMSNKHYRHGTAATGHVLVDCQKIYFQAGGSKSPGAHKKIGESEIPGLLYFDENGNKAWEESCEYAVSYTTEIGLDKQIYPVMYLKALAKLPEFKPPGNWPSKLATAAEAQAFYNERDGSLNIKDVSAAFPNVPVCIFGSRLDHLQRQPDHPHIAMQYNAWLGAQHPYVRLNPDQVYVAAAALMRANNFANNKPNVSVDADAIDLLMEQEGIVPDYVFMEAAAAELSDRVLKGKIKTKLEEPLVNYSNGAKPPAEPAASEAKK
ncbi:MAG: hypothetical protein K2W82_03765 [Candidatus Obscuribacterales bacterium]|nr:hypothetical protein [Candidatus Obscuribacterales bacterium]